MAPRTPKSISWSALAVRGLQNRSKELPERSWIFRHSSKVTPFTGIGHTVWMSGSNDGDGLGLAPTGDGDGVGNGALTWIFHPIFRWLVHCRLRALVSVTLPQARDSRGRGVGVGHFALLPTW